MPKKTEGRIFLRALPYLVWQILHTNDGTLLFATLNLPYEDFSAFFGLFFVGLVRETLFSGMLSLPFC